MADIYKKRTINAIYKSLNDRAKVKCKGRFPDSPNDFQVCYHQAMADNARTLASKLRAQLGTCRNTINPIRCKKQIINLVKYMEQQQGEHENHVDQLHDLREE